MVNNKRKKKLISKKKVSVIKIFKDKMKKKNLNVYIKV